MKTETIESFIDALNTNSYQDFIFLRQLSKNVHIAKVWHDLPEASSLILDGYNVYFIKKGVEFIGAVLDMGIYDLHWFVKLEHRKQGNLTNALKETILPDLFKDGREFQCITISLDSEEDEKNSLSVAKAVGFKNDGKRWILKKEELEVSKTYNYNEGLSEERFKILRNKVNHALGIIKMVRDEVHIAYQHSEELDDLVEGTAKFVTHKLEDFYWDNKTNG